MSRGRVELVYFDGCPNAEAARRSIGEALEELGADADWAEWDVLADDTPSVYRSYPSPTVLVCGRDVLGSAGRVEPSDVIGIACRAEGAPTTAQVRAALLKNR